jgi:hypothetical protein
MPWGTITVSDTLRALAQSTAPVAQFGVQEAYALIERDLAYHNRLVRQELIPDLCVITEDREMVYGSRADMTVEEIDEFGRPDTQKVGAAAVLGFPLSSYGRSVGWTWDAMQVMPAQELAEQYQAMRNADLNGIRANITRRLFNPLNSLTYLDRKIDNRTLKLRAFTNADSEVVMTGPNGETFNAATHTHFNGTASLTAANVLADITNVIEHGTVGEVVLYINAAQEAAIRGFTGSGEFSPFVDMRIRQSTTTTFAQGDSLDVLSPGDRAIGIFGAATVWVKPWIPANYYAVIDKGAGPMKPLAFRTRPGGVLADFGFRGRYRSEDFPLYADTLARDYGIGVRQRHMVAVRKTDNATYSAPTIS